MADFLKNIDNPFQKKDVPWFALAVLAAITFPKVFIAAGALLLGALLGVAVVLMLLYMPQTDAA